MFKRDEINEVIFPQVNPGNFYKKSNDQLLFSKHKFLCQKWNLFISSLVIKKIITS